MHDFKIISKSKSILGESPLWDEKCHKLYWVDIEGKKLHSWNFKSKNIESWNFKNRICSISLTDNENILLCAFEKYFAFYNMNSKEIKKINLDINLSDTVRFNDGKTDDYGRFWCGTMSEANPKTKEACIYMLDENLNLKTMFKNIYISNSLTNIRDTKGMYFSDSYTKKIYKATLTDDLNELKHVKVFKNNSNLKGAPDGSTTDKYGNLWNAEWDGSRLVKYDPDGNILEEVAVPVKRPTSCVFGGPNLDILFITSAECESDKDTSINGNLIYFRTNTKGVFSNRFSINNLKI